MMLYDKVSPAAVKNGGYLPLGAFRLVLAVIVYACHADLIWISVNEYVYTGPLGVTAFFTVSALVIFAAYDNHYRGRVGAFLTNRAIRLYPTLWVAYGSSFLLMAWFGVEEFAQLSLKHFDPWLIPVALTAILANVIGGGHAFDTLSPAWSIAVELKFYVVAAILFLAAERLGSKWGPRLLVIAGWLFCMGFVYVYTSDGHVRYYAELIFAPFFVLGASLYFVVIRGVRSAPVLALTAASLAGSITFSLTHDDWKLAASLFPLDGPRLTTAISFLLLTALALLLLSKRPVGLLAATDKFMGDLTYPLYLSHRLTIAAAIFLFQPEGWLGWFGVLAASLAVAWVLFQVVDAPLKWLRNRIRGKRV